MPENSNDTWYMKKILTLKIIISLVIAYLSFSVFCYLKSYYGLDFFQHLFPLVITIAICIIHVTIDSFVKPQVSISSSRHRHLNESTKSNFNTPPAKESCEDLLNSCNKLQHELEDVSMLGRKLQSAIKRGISPRMMNRDDSCGRSFLNSSQLLNKIRSSGAMTPSALDVSPIERANFSDRNGEVFVKNTLPYSPFAELNCQTELRKIAVKNVSALSEFDSSAEFEKARRNIELSDFSELSQSLISDSKKSNETGDKNHNAESDLSDDIPKVNDKQIDKVVIKQEKIEVQNEITF